MNTNIDMLINATGKDLEELRRDGWIQGNDSVIGFGDRVAFIRSPYHTTHSAYAMHDLLKGWIPARLEPTVMYRA